MSFYSAFPCLVRFSGDLVLERLRARDGAPSGAPTRAPSERIGLGFGVEGLGTPEKDPAKTTVLLTWAFGGSVLGKSGIFSKAMAGIRLGSHLFFTWKSRKEARLTGKSQV